MWYMAWCYYCYKPDEMSCGYVVVITSNVLRSPTMTWLTVTEYLCHKLPWICSVCRDHNPGLSFFMTSHRVCNNNNTTPCTTCGAGITYPSGTHEVIPDANGLGKKVIRIRKSKKNRQYKDQKKKDKQRSTKH
jgi:hypothetical protein